MALRVIPSVKDRMLSDNLDRLSQCQLKTNTMAQVKLGWDRKTVADKLIKADYIAQQMTDNVATFATPLPTIEDVTNAIGALRNAAIAAEAGGYALTFAKNEAETSLDQLISQLMSYVQNVSAGDPEVILLSGMEVRRDPQPTPVPLQVQNLNALPSRAQGSIDLNWDALDRRAIYQLEQWIDPEEDDQTGFWSKVATPSKSKYTVDNLTTGKVYRFRVAGIGTDDRIGPYSQEATSVAP